MAEAIGNPWEFQRPEVVYHVHFGGSVEHVRGKGPRSGDLAPDARRYKPLPTIPRSWVGAASTSTRLRLWSARSPDPLKLDVFNTGDYLGASAEEARAESICKFLYPNDESPAGRELRLRQEYFFVSASLQDLIKRHLTVRRATARPGQSKAAVAAQRHPSQSRCHRADAHPGRSSQLSAGTMRGRSRSRRCPTPTTHCCRKHWRPGLSNCSNGCCPGNLEIIYRINDRASGAGGYARCPGDVDFRASVSLIDERSGRKVRMGQLAFVGSHRINGVSAMHSDLMKETVFHDLNHLYPARITNKTNGITFRRWLMLANPRLTDLLREACGEAVLDDPSQLAHCSKPAPAIMHSSSSSATVKHHNKIVLARLIGERLNVKIDRRRAVRRPDQAHPRIQATVTQHP